MKKIIITGSNGYVASRIISELNKKYNLTLIDLDSNNIKLSNVTIVNLDLFNEKLEKIISIFKGHDAIIHLAYKRPKEIRNATNIENEINAFEIENSNVIMANKIYRAAYEANIKRIITASSNHAADWYEHYEVHNKKRDMIGSDLLPYSDNFYGWSKASYELLSIPYASGKFGKKLEFIHVRIGYPREITEELKFSSSFQNQFIKGNKGKGVINLKRHLGAYISSRDLTQLFDKAISVSKVKGHIDNVPFLVVYGVSDNTRRFWSLDTAKEYLNYSPQDDSEVKFSELIRNVIDKNSLKSKLG
jgi:nucleoside-diphosphate-sugar epimerase